MISTRTSPGVVIEAGLAGFPAPWRSCFPCGQWNHMKGLYAGSVKSGIYLAPRGISNGPGLHAETNSFPLYDRLIENMILFEGVDPNRVYLLGYSAGGDGVYQTSPRMADRFAAANMSAGHHNSVNPTNLHNLPFLLQVGENDRAYGRHRATVNYYLRMNDLERAHPGSYLHDVYVHAGRGHGFNDRGGAQAVMANPEGWMHQGDRTTKSIDTNAIRWLSGHTRNPLPEKVIWELSTRAPMRWFGGEQPDGKSFWLSNSRGRQFYWLDLTKGDISGTIVARIDRPTNEEFPSTAPFRRPGRSPAESWSKTGSPTRRPELPATMAPTSMLLMP